MAVKADSSLTIRVNSEVKREAQKIFSDLGLDTTTAFNIFLRQVIVCRGLPFEVRLPAHKPVDVTTLSEEAFHEVLERGYADMEDGRVQNVKNAFTDLKREFDL